MPQAGITYAQNMKDLKKMANGNVLLAFKNSTTSGKAFQKAVQRVVKQKGKVLYRTLKVTFEGRDFDETMTKEEVVEALKTKVCGTC